MVSVLPVCPCYYHKRHSISPVLLTLVLGLWWTSNMQHSLWSHGSVISGWRPYSIDYSCRTIIHHAIIPHDTQNWFGEHFEVFWWIMWLSYYVMWWRSLSACKILHLIVVESLDQLSRQLVQHLASVWGIWYVKFLHSIWLENPTWYEMSIQWLLKCWCSKRECAKCRLF